MRSIRIILCLLLSALASQVSLAQTASSGKMAGPHGISLNGAVEHPRSLTLAALEHEPATIEAVSLKNRERPTDR